MGQFKKGQSGNPAGRPAGTRNKATLAVEALLDGEAETLSHPSQLCRVMNSRFGLSAQAAERLIDCLMAPA